MKIKNKILMKNIYKNLLVLIHIIFIYIYYLYNIDKYLYNIHLI